MSKTSEKLPVLRLSITGVFMGLANLVPGVSGGTMVLALGLYEEFIESMARATRLPGQLMREGVRPALRSFARPAIVLLMLFGISFVTIVLLSSVIERLMALFQPGMLALFIGMTLGGAPMLWREMQPLRTPSVVGLVVGFSLMALIAFVFKPGGGDPGWVLFFIGGVVASSAMILPGISGSYLLLILGLYLPVISGISDGVHALRMRDLGAAIDIGLRIGLPVAAGLFVGIIAFSNLIKFCLEKFHAPTIGFLMGLLLGSVLGLYPFQTTSFDKLPRYAQNDQLMVVGYGWQATAGDPVYDGLRTLEQRGLRLVVQEEATSLPSLEELAVARASGAVVVVYDQVVPRDIRKEAQRKEDNRRVELMTVPNAERTPVKTAIVVGLVGIGFVLTLLLGRLGGKKDKGSDAGAATATA